MCSCDCPHRRRRRAPRPLLVPLGELRGLIYRCRRVPWEAPANYVHFFHRRRPTLATDPGGRRLYVLGGCFRVTERGIEG